MSRSLAHAKPVHQRISVSSTAYLATVSLSLASLSLYFLSIRDSAFWFFLSNAIIFLIAAADSDSDPSSALRAIDLYDEYLKNSRSKVSMYLIPLPEPSQSPSLEAEASESATGKDSKKTDSPPLDLILATESALSPEFVKRDSDIGSRGQEWDKAAIDDIASLDQKKQDPDAFQKASIFFIDGAANDFGCKNQKQDRDELEKAAIVAIEDTASDFGSSDRKKQDDDDSEKASIVAYDESVNDAEANSGGGELSALSIEELNRRVEDFIRRFNREIWLQERKSQMKKI